MFDAKTAAKQFLVKSAEARARAMFLEMMDVADCRADSDVGEILMEGLSNWELLGHPQQMPAKVSAMIRENSSRPGLLDIERRKRGIS